MNPESFPLPMYHRRLKSYEQIRKGDKYCYTDTPYMWHDVSDDHFRMLPAYYHNMVFCRYEEVLKPKYLILPRLGNVPVRINENEYAITELTKFEAGGISVKKYASPKHIFLVVFERGIPKIAERFDIVTHNTVKTFLSANLLSFLYQDYLNKQPPEDM